jgi:hypothetical protein
LLASRMATAWHQRGVQTGVAPGRHT